MISPVSALALTVIRGARSHPSATITKEGFVESTARGLAFLALRGFSEIHLALSRHRGARLEIRIAVAVLAHLHRCAFHLTAAVRAALHAEGIGHVTCKRLLSTTTVTQGIDARYAVIPIPTTQKRAMVANIKWGDPRGGKPSVTSSHVMSSRKEIHTAPKIHRIMALPLRNRVRAMRQR
jgi:hypothetical protein